MNKVTTDCGTDKEGTLCIVKYGNIQIGYVTRLRGVAKWTAVRTLPRGATANAIRSSFTLQQLYDSKQDAANALQVLDEST